MSAPVGRLHHLVVDCREPLVEAAFWSAVLGQPVTYESEDFVVVSTSDRASGLAFQRAPGHLAPVWPGEASALQMHLDVMVDDLEAAGARVVAFGARPLDGNTFADPAGHPFCLVRRPGWAAPVG